MLEIEVVRGGVSESRHRIHAVVAEASGRVVRTWGDAGRVTLLRSAAKPFQALPLAADGAADRFGLTQEEIALCCGSHNAEEPHLEAARSILAKAGLREAALACGPHRSLLGARARAMAEAGIPLTPIASNCSGKHAGMLALAVHHGWPSEGYERFGHPVQVRIGREVSRWTGVPPEEAGQVVDGCGVPCFAVPLECAAVAAARLSEEARGPGPVRRIATAMVHHPFMVAGTKRLCTRLMEEEGGRLFAKAGAEGVYLAGDLERGLGVALKVDDGAWRAAPPALLAVLVQAGLLSDEARSALAEFAEPPLTNTLGDVVGCIRVR